MASENETVEGIADYIRHMADNLPNGLILTITYCNFIADSIETAHSREVDELTFKLMTAKSEQKTAANVIIEQTNNVEKLEREIAVKDAERKGILKSNASLAADNNRLRREIEKLHECLNQAIFDHKILEECFGRGWRCDTCGRDCIVHGWLKVMKGERNEQA